MHKRRQIIRVEFDHFKAFESFTLHLRHFNILVGPNNAGKSTILAAFRILAAAMRRARVRNPTIVRDRDGSARGYPINIDGISVAEENIFYNYDDSEPARVTFTLSNRNELVLNFPERGVCHLFARGEAGAPTTISAFKKSFDCQIGFVPILGPVDHREYLYRKEAARLALYNYTAARNFRNIWYHFPDRFNQFRQLLNETWPGMDIEPPRVDHTYEKPVLHMFCPEERIPREIFWAGFGFQVWCQMLTHLVQSSDKSIFLIDEPDIYLHADLQRQLLGLLRNMGPDILIATHSTEIITEAEADDIVLINKKRRSSRRIKHPSELSEIFTALGSNLNPILTQLAKTRRVVFVEGSDFQIISKFARKVGHHTVANRTEFAVVPVEGFNPERVRSLRHGMEKTLGSRVSAAAILDRDYRSLEECKRISEECQEVCDLVRVHGRKEVENFLLVPAAMDRAATRRLAEKNRRTGSTLEYKPIAVQVMEAYVKDQKTTVTSQHLAFRRRFDKRYHPGQDEATSNTRSLAELEEIWPDLGRAMMILPGKGALSRFNEELQETYGISVTATGIVDAMKDDEIPEEMIALIGLLDSFTRSRPGRKERQSG